MQLNHWGTSFCFVYCNNIRWGFPWNKVSIYPVRRLNSRIKPFFVRLSWMTFGNGIHPMQIFSCGVFALFRRARKYIAKPCFFNRIDNDRIPLCFPRSAVNILKRNCQLALRTDLRFSNTFCVWQNVVSRRRLVGLDSGVKLKSRSIGLYKTRVLLKTSNGRRRSVYVLLV